MTVLLMPTRCPYGHEVTQGLAHAEMIYCSDCKGFWGLVRPELQASVIELAEELVNEGFCPSCGCDLWNTKGCPTCPAMRKAYELLVGFGKREPRTFSPFAEADAINIRNMQGNA